MPHITFHRISKGDDDCYTKSQLTAYFLSLSPEKCFMISKSIDRVPGRTKAEYFLDKKFSELIRELGRLYTMSDRCQLIHDFWQYDCPAKCGYQVTGLKIPRIPSPNYHKIALLKPVRADLHFTDRRYKHNPFSVSQRWLSCFIACLTEEEHSNLFHNRDPVLRSILSTQCRMDRMKQRYPGKYPLLRVYT